MGVVTLNPNVKPSSTGPYSHIPSNPAAGSSISTTPLFIFIGGPLSERRWLTPILVKIVEENREESENREFVVTETKYYMHGAGETITDAIAAFKRIVSQYLDGLTEREERLSPRMHEQLEYLRSVIRIS